MTTPLHARRALAVLLLGVIVAGCSASSTGSPALSAQAPTPIPTTVAAVSGTPDATPMATVSATGSPSINPSINPATSAPSANPAAAVLAARAWARATLTDVTTGQPFAIAGFAGRTIFIETMAIWCTNCRAQQARFMEALKRLDPARVAYVVLTVDPSETAAALAKYKADRGFTGTYAVAGREVSAALVAEFGANAINPPSVPLVLVRPSGQITFKTGDESIDQIVALAGG